MQCNTHRARKQAQGGCTIRLDGVHEDVQFPLAAPLMLTVRMKLWQSRLKNVMPVSQMLGKGEGVEIHQSELPCTNFAGMEFTGVVLPRGLA